MYRAISDNVFTEKVTWVSIQVRLCLRAEGTAPVTAPPSPYNEHDMDRPGTRRVRSLPARALSPGAPD